jgi:hypothetical protein
MYKTIKSNLEIYKAKTLISQFRFWLSLKKYSLSTINNYLADVNKYLLYILSLLKKSSPVLTFEDLRIDQVFSKTTLRSYLVSIASDKHLPRYLASLAKFFQFAKDQNLILLNCFPKTKKQVFSTTPSSGPQGQLDTASELLIQQFQTYLTQQNLNPANIKNHLKNLREYIIWHQQLGRT